MENLRTMVEVCKKKLFSLIFLRYIGERGGDEVTPRCYVKSYMFTAKIIILNNKRIFISVMRC